MAKTKDLTIAAEDFTQEKTYTLKKQNCLKLDSDRNNYTFEYNAEKKLIITCGGKSVTVTNPAKVKYVKALVEGEEKLFNTIGDNIVDNLNAILYNRKKKAYVGTAYNDNFASTEKNETIVLGKGENTLTYDTGKIGTDVIKLTKGEKLNIAGTAFENEYNFEQGSTKKTKNDLVIKFNDNNQITVKNYYGKETGANVLINGENLKETRKITHELKDGEKSYSGSALADIITANNLTKASKVIKNVEYGVTLNGGAGSDSIIGSNYADTLKAGTTGYDTIRGGKGNDVVYGGTSKDSTTLFIFEAQGGADTVYSGNGEDTLKFLNSNIKNISFTNNKADLIIKYNTNEGDSVTVKNYYKVNKKGIITGLNPKNSIKRFAVNEGTYNLADIIFGEGTITGTEGNDLIVGSPSADTITGGYGNDTLFGGTGHDRYIFNKGDGKDEINYKSGNDIIKFNNAKVEDMDIVVSDNKIIITYGEGDILTVKDYPKNTETITIEDSTGKQYALIKDWSEAGYHITSNKNHIIAGSSSTNRIIIDKGENIIFGNGGSDDISTNTGTKNIIVIKASDGATYVSSRTKQDTIKLTDLKIEDLAFSINDDYAKILYNDELLVRVSSFFKNGDINILDCKGTHTTMSEQLGMIMGDGENDQIAGTDDNDIIVGTDLNETITGGRGNDTLYGMYGDNTYVFNKGDGDDSIYANIDENKPKLNDIIKFADSDMEDLDFEKDGNNLRIFYNNRANSVFVRDYFYRYIPGSDNNKVTNFMVQGDNTVYSIEEYNRHVIVNDGETTEYTGTDINDIFESSALDEHFTGLAGKNTYNFTVGSIGNDTISSISSKDIIKISGLEQGESLAYSINGDDVEITKDEEKIILKDFMLNAPAVTVQGDNIETTTIAEQLLEFGIMTGSGVINGTEENDVIIGSPENDTITAGLGNDAMNGGLGDNIYVFNTGDGEDVINYAGGNDIIQFNDALVDDMDFVRDGNNLDIYYGENDKLTLRNYSTDIETIKVKDSSGTIYTLKLCPGWNSNVNGKNTIFVGHTSRDSIQIFGNDGDKCIIFTNGGGDSIYSMGGDTTYLIKKAHDYTSLRTDVSETEDINAVIKFVDTTLDDISIVKTEYSPGQYTYNDYDIYFNNGENRVNLPQFGIHNTDYTIVDSTGTSKKLTELGFIFEKGTVVGTENADNIVLQNWNINTISGNGGNDTIYMRGGINTVYTNKIDTKDTSGSTVTIFGGGNTDTIYAQSSVNIIYNENGSDNYFAYIDQKTSIFDEWGNDTLTLTNTIDTTDGARSNLHVLFNVTSDYDYDAEDESTLFKKDILITNTANKTNYDLWKANGNYKGISIYKNDIETVKSSNNYTLTTVNVSLLAESVATWLTNNGYTSVDGVFSNALEKADNNSADITALIAKFDEANWNIPA